MRKLVLIAGLAAGLALSSVSAFGLTVTFTEIPLPNGTLFTNQYAAYNLNGINDYIYNDARDTFDGVGISDTGNPGIVQFLTLVNSLSIDYVLVNGASCSNFSDLRRAA
jgi:hypothetical protein